MGFRKEDQDGQERSEAEARKAEEIAERRAYLEQKLADAREAKRRAQLTANTTAPAPRTPAAPQIKPPFSGQAFTAMLYDALAAMEAGTPGSQLIPAGQPLRPGREGRRLRRQPDRPARRSLTGG